MAKDSRKLIHLIAAARPNFMKVAPLYHELADAAWGKPVLVHTGQHYDRNMAGDIMEQLGLPSPDISLGVGSGSHAEQTGLTMIAYEQACLEDRPDLVIVVGDVNATVACGLVAAKLGIPLAHLEAGLRSFDRTMPEEINRIITDAISDILWIPSEDAKANLLHEGVPEEKIIFVGNIMIDSLLMLKPAIDSVKMVEKLSLSPKDFGVVTIHRPSNVDNPRTLELLVDALVESSKKTTLVFPVHPRTQKQLESFGLIERLRAATNVRLTGPLPYVEFMSLVSESRLVITDSGGIQEETTFLGLPCLTLRENTERPITVTLGTNSLCPVPALLSEVERALKSAAAPKTIKFWDGQTAGRIAQSIERFLA